LNLIEQAGCFAKEMLDFVDRGGLYGENTTKDIRS